MQLEQQVCSLELAKKLGANQKSYFVWVEGTDIKHNWVNERIESELVHQKNGFNLYLAFTVAELGVMLRNVEKGSIECNFYESDESKTCIVNWVVYDQYLCIKESNVCEEYTEAAARAKMLIYLLEKNLIKNA